MEFKAKDIAALLRGVVEGDPEIKVSGVSKIEEGKTNTLAFLANPKYEQYIYSTNASIVLVNNDFVPSQPLACTLIRVQSAYEAIGALLNMYEKMRPQPLGIEQPSYIHESVVKGEGIYVGAFAYVGKGVKIGNNVKIYPQVYIGDGVEIGDDTVIYAGVKIYYGCKIGKSCTIQAGAVIGADGFGFAPSEEGYNKIAQIGNVILEDNVEIGANTCIDRATMGSTVIKRGTKLDNLIQIAHNVVVGENTVMASQCGVAGTTKIGANCMFGGQVGLAGHLVIEDDVKLAAQSGVTNNIKAGQTFMGAPAFDVSAYRKAYVIFRKLPQIYSQISDINKEIQILKSNK